MDVKNKQLLQDLYAGIVMDVKNQQLLRNLYASITMDVKNQQLLRDIYADICNGCKKLITITRPYMWVLHIGNYNKKDVGIA